MKAALRRRKESSRNRQRHVAAQRAGGRERLRSRRKRPVDGRCEARKPRRRRRASRIVRPLEHASLSPSTFTALASRAQAILARTPPPAVPGIHFLSGGMGAEEATLNLQALALEGVMRRAASLVPQPEGDGSEVDGPSSASTVRPASGKAPREANCAAQSRLTDVLGCCPKTLLGIIWDP